MMVKCVERLINSIDWLIQYDQRPTTPPTFYPHTQTTAASTSFPHWRIIRLKCHQQIHYPHLHTIKFIYIPSRIAFMVSYYYKLFLWCIECVCVLLMCDHAHVVFTNNPPHLSSTLANLPILSFLSKRIRQPSSAIESACG